MNQNIKVPNHMISFPKNKKRKYKNTYELGSIQQLGVQIGHILWESDPAARVSSQTAQNLFGQLNSTLFDLSHKNCPNC